jgi:putative transposase
MRANRCIQNGYVYHLTARCNEREFLLKFGRWRDEYRRRLREALSLFDVWLLTYGITSNHTHLVVTAASARELAAFMDKLQGEFAQWYNRCKKRSGHFWGDRYHCTMVQDGEHLWNCLVYVDLNMVRAGVVAHPSAWAWTAYRELVGTRKRYRLVDAERLVELTQAGDLESFRRDYVDAVSQVLQTRVLSREPRWTESIAVGDEEYVRDIAERARGRASLRLAEADDGVWTVRDSQSSCVGDGLDGAVLLRSDFGWGRIDSKESSARIGG